MVIMAIFPISPSKAAWNSSITQAWEVQEAATASGKRRTLCQQAYPAWAFKLKFPALTFQQVQSLTGFYAQMKGKWGSFFYMDYDNHNVDGIQLAGNGDTYYCISNLSTLAEPVSKVTNLHVYIDGTETTDYTETKGVITLSETTTGTVTASYDYYYLVSFSGDLSIAQTFKDLYNVSITLKVVRE